jgi:tetrahydromethanopterin S-methyltransferase subunit G
MSIADTLTSARATALTEHYQRTVDLVSRAWERRNRQFIILIAVLAAAVLVAFSRQMIAPVLQALIAEHVPKLPGPAADRLSTFLPLATDLLLALLVVAIFYLMASLCHGSGMIINSYIYLGMLEREVRAELKLSRYDVAFTREGPFFEVTGRKLTRLIGFCYKLVLGLLLVSFFALRIYFDLPGEGTLATLPGREEAVRWYGWLVGNFLLVIDIAVAIPTLMLFARYARLSPMDEAVVRKRLARLQENAADEEDGPQPAPRPVPAPGLRAQST